jgi:hypothetical protein
MLKEATLLEALFGGWGDDWPPPLANNDRMSKGIERIALNFRFAFSFYGNESM